MLKGSLSVYKKQKRRRRVGPNDEALPNPQLSGHRWKMLCRAGGRLGVMFSSLLPPYLVHPCNPTHLSLLRLNVWRETVNLPCTLLIPGSSWDRDGRKDLSQPHEAFLLGQANHQEPGETEMGRALV